MVPKVGLPAVWIRNGDWANVATLGVVVGFVLWHARYAVTQRHDPWRVEGPIERRTTRVTRALVAAALVEVVVGSGALVATQSARAAWTAPVSNGTQTFSAAMWHRYYLQSATPVGGTTPATLPLSTIDTPPTAAVLPNYDPAIDGDSGQTVLRGGTQYWYRHLTGGGAVAFNGPTSLTVWTAMAGFDTAASGSAVARLLDCNNAPPGACTVVATATVSSAGSWTGGASGWIPKAFDFGTPNYTVPNGAYLTVQVSVPPGSGGDVMFAYDTTAYPSGLTVLA
jgi:hypothetical protein